MPWSSLAGNQCVSLDNLKDAVATGVFTALTTIPSGTKQITKSEALTYVNIQTAPLASKANNQLVVKNNLVATGATTTTTTSTTTTTTSTTTTTTSAPTLLNTDILYGSNNVANLSIYKNSPISSSSNALIGYSSFGLAYFNNKIWAADPSQYATMTEFTVVKSPFSVSSSTILSLSSSVVLTCSKDSSNLIGYLPNTTQSIVQIPLSNPSTYTSLFSLSNSNYKVLSILYNSSTGRFLIYLRDASNNKYYLQEYYPDGYVFNGAEITTQINALGVTIIGFFWNSGTLYAASSKGKTYSVNTSTFAFTDTGVTISAFSGTGNSVTVLTQDPQYTGSLPTPPSVVANWSYSHGTSSCTASQFTISRRGVNIVQSTIASGTATGSVTLYQGDVLTITSSTGVQSGTGCQNAYVQYSGGQFVSNGGAANYNNAQITVTVSASDISAGVVNICGTLGNGVCPV